LAQASALDEPQLAVRDGQLLAPRLAALKAAEGGVDLRPAWHAGTVLITGGTAGLGALLARHLVDAYSVRSLVLVSRRGEEAPGARELRTQLTQSGAQVVIHAADASDAAELDVVLASIPLDKPLTAVMHVAGVLDDGVLQSLTPDRVERVLKPKVQAAMLLDERTRGLNDLGAFVLFSSLAGTIGSAGQAAYAAANACLDALAERRRHAGLPALSLAWGRWAEAGTMTAHLDTSDTRRLGPALSAEEGLALFDAALSLDEAVVIPVHVDRAMIRTLVGGGLVPPVLRALLPTPARRSARLTGTRMADQLHQLAPAARRPFLLDLVRGQVAAVLGVDLRDGFGADAPFSDMGLDSLKVVELRNRLSDASGIRLAATLAFDYPTPGAVADFLAERFEAAVAPRPQVMNGFDNLETMVSALVERDGQERVAAQLREVLARVVASGERRAEDVVDRIQAASADSMLELLEREFGVHVG
jgi:NAD(P)-dependent dehydrogenase (short-subunit alcohol dehydrogenase family)